MPNQIKKIKHCCIHSLQLSVLVIRPVSTDNPISTRLYTTNIVNHIDGQLARISMLQLNNISSPVFVSKILEALLRYIVYPARIILSPENIVHITDSAYSFLVIPARLMRKKVIVTLQNRVEDIVSDTMLSRHQENMFIPWLNKLLFRFSIHQIFKADHIITVSKTITDSLIRLGYPKNKITTSFMPISDLFFSKLSTGDKKEIEKLKREKGGSFWIFHPGNNDQAHKNIEHIFFCLQTLISKGYDVKFIKAGDPFNKRQINLIKKLNIQSSIIHKDMCSQKMLNILYHASDVLLFPSYYEGCPAPPLEALASGLPIIVSHIPAHTSLFHSCAFFVDPDKPKESTGIIEQLITRALSPRMLLARGKKLVSGMKWKYAAKDTLRAYKSMQYDRK